MGGWGGTRLCAELGAGQGLLAELGQWGVGGCGGIKAVGRAGGSGGRTRLLTELGAGQGLVARAIHVTYLPPAAAGS